MASVVEYTLEGPVAILRVNNPPVNALSHKVRLGLQTTIQSANRNPAVKSLIIYGQDRFLAGADIKEFATGESRHEPSLPELCEVLESNQKPIVCAIEGYAFGGGFEVAISSHYRVASSKAMFGFPEVDLGILPAATGTQRFPRLVGLRHALDLIPNGKRFSASKALQIGAIDKVVESNILKEAVKFAESIADRPLDGRRTSRMKVKDAENAAALRDAAIATVSRKFPGVIAPLFNIKSVMAAVEYPFKEGCEKEREFSFYLFTSGQARALQYVFFAQRKATQWTLPSGASYKNTKAKPINSIAVVGGGTMGTGIAMAALNAGIPVTLVEQNQKFLESGIKTLKSLYEGSVSLGLMSLDDAKRRVDKLTTTVDLTQIKNVDLVIEAVYENLELKQEIFAKLDTICKRDAFLCSNTSGLDIDKIASATKRPEKVMGMHFFVPAYHMKLLENVRGRETAPETIAVCTALGNRIGKVPVLVGNCRGFVGNRMLGPSNTECVFLVEEGCLPHEVDQIKEDFGFPLGGFKVMDLSGLDVGKYISEGLAKTAGIRLDLDTRSMFGSRWSPLGNRLCHHGRHGRKTGAGWYNYDKPGGKVPYVSDFVTNLIVDYRRQFGIERRKITPQEILERLFYSLINEGFKILEEGIVTSPEEIDTIWLLGYAWPRQTGGPMFYASSIGLDNVYKAICRYNQQHVTSPHWVPSKLLGRLAESNVPMSEWRTHVPSRL